MASSYGVAHALPPEIADIICNAAEEEDISSLRLVSKFWHNVATPYLTEEARLIFKQSSFTNLSNVASHLPLSKHVKSLYYEPNVLHRHPWVEWEENLLTRVNCDELPPPPSLGASRRDWRSWHRALTKACRPETPSYTEAEKDEAWEIYRKLLLEQEDLRAGDYGASELQDALSRFPQLVKVNMNHGWGLWSRDGNPRKPKTDPYAAALTHAGGDHHHADPSGVRQMRSLMLAIRDAKRKIDTLRVGDVSWKFLQQDEATLNKMKEVLIPLEVLQLVISTGFDFDEEEIGTEIPECRRFLSNNKLHDFISAAPDLKHLTICFDWYEPYCPALFINVVDSTRWSYLRRVTFECIETSEHDWLDFFQRHSPTLKSVAVNTIGLLDGEWSNVLENMQQCLNLEWASFHHDLFGDDPPQHWNLEPSPWVSSGDMGSQGNRTRKALEEFMVNGGSCPLRDEVAHPQGYNEGGRPW